MILLEGLYRIAQAVAGQLECAALIPRDDDLILLARPTLLRGDRCSEEYDYTQHHGSNRHSVSLRQMVPKRNQTSVAERLMK